MAAEMFGHIWKVFPIEYSFLANDLPVSQYITLSWPLSGFLILEEIPQSTTAREIIYFKTGDDKVSNGTLILK